MNLTERLESLTLAEKLAEAKADSFEAESAKIDAMILALRQQIGELQEKQRGVKAEKQLVVSGELRPIQRQKHEVEAEVEVERIAAEAEIDALSAFKAFDELAAGEPWMVGNEFGDKAYKHQIDGAYLLANTGRAILADSVGLGKTLTAVAWMKLRQSKRVVIFCPGETMSQFEAEILKWSKRPPFVIGRKPKKEVRALLGVLKFLDEWVLICNYESWNRDRALLDEFTYMNADTLICDEAHKIKETKTSAYKGVEKVALARNKCGECGEFYLSCSHNVSLAERSMESVLMMTGTPILNRPAEIWPLLHIIDPRNFYSVQAFNRSYCTYDYELNRYVFRDGGMASLAQRLRGMYLRRTRSDTDIKIPPQTIQHHNIELSVEDNAMQLELLSDLHNHSQIQLTDEKTAGFMSILALITRQRQAATWPGGMEIKVPILNPQGWPETNPDGSFKYEIYPVPEKYWQSAKMDAAVEFCKELVEDGQRVIVASQFLKALEEFNRRIGAPSADTDQPIRSVVYAGPTPHHLRDEIKSNLDRSNHEEPKWDVVCAHYKIGGVGLNFTAATQMIVLDEEWNPGMNEQFYGRTDRIGQTEETTVHVFRTLDTVDEWMAALIQMKKDMLEGWNKENSDVQAELVKILQKKPTYLTLVR
jgi:SNF2 family DNA or RNA helicase